MDMSTETNVIEIIEINVQWKTTLVFRLTTVLKINLESPITNSFWPSFYLLSLD